tara:strand:+ start:737 stop:8449 length:7713 start_codon:yes stop_codon:yes gene_type:complete
MPLRIPAEVVGLERSIQQQAQKAGRNLKINLGTSARSVEALSQPLGRITGKADEFTKSMEAANARVLAFGASVAVINGVTQGFRALVTTTIEVEKSLANINSILKQNSANLEQFKKQIFDVARNTEQTFQATAEAALELSRQGLSATEVTKRLNDSLVLSRISGLNAADAVAGLTAAINAFNSTGITSAEVLNKISAAAASAAVSDRDLIEAIKRSGSVAVTTGVQFEELVGIVSALQEKTARGGSVIGNSLKTIFTRITTLDKLKTLSNLGVQVEDLEGNVLSANKIIENLSKVFNTLGRQEKINLADKLVGKFQIAPFLALLEDYSGKVARSAEVAEVAFNATNEAYQRNAALNKTLAALINETTLNAKELANTLGEIGVTDSLRNILGFFSGLIGKINEVLEGEGVGSTFARGIVKGLSKIISGPGLAIFGAIIAKLTVDLAKFGIGSLKTFFGLNKAAQAQAQLQGQIASTLLNNSSIQKKILDIENMQLSVEQKRALQTKFFTDALNAQLAIMRQMQSISATIAPAVMRGTAGGRGRRASGGFLPVGAERSDIARGVGGAPSSARPVVIPNFAYGGGNFGPMVVNTSEYIVPNYARGGDAVFNQDMASSMGLPSNAKKVRSAGGYIPNFARSATRNNVMGKAARGMINPTQQLVLFVGDRGGDEFPVYTVGKVAGKTQAYVNPAEAPKDMDAVARVNVPTYRLRHKGQNKEPNDIEKIKSKISEGASQAAQQFASNLAAPAKLPTITRDRIKSLFNPGAFEGFAGSTFEVAIASILESRQFADYAARTATSRIDLPYSPRLFDKFGAKGVGKRGAEVKATGKTDLKKGAAVKFYDILVGKQAAAKYNRKADPKTGKIRFAGREVNKTEAKRLYGIGGTQYSQIQRQLGVSGLLSRGDIHQYNLANPGSIRFTGTAARSPFAVRGRAGGYIPNYSALDDAVARETSAGLPLNQVRINQSGKLRNSQNPMGLAVTNVRDEPTGTIPNSAGGFIPNYMVQPSVLAGAGGGGAGAPRTRGISGSGPLGSGSPSKAAGDVSGKLIGLSIATSLLSSSMGTASEELEGGAAKAAKFGEGLTNLLTTLLLFKALNVPMGMPFGRASAGRRASVIGGMWGRGMRRSGSAPLRGLGKIAGGIGRGLGRFLPVIGPVILGFQALNAVFGGKPMEMLKKGLRGLGEALGFVDTPAEKAAQAMNKLTGAIYENLTAENARKKADDFFDKLIKEQAEREARRQLGPKAEGVEEGKELEALERLLTRRSALGPDNLPGGPFVGRTGGMQDLLMSRALINLQTGLHPRGGIVRETFDLGGKLEVDRSKFQPGEAMPLFDLLGEDAQGNRISKIQIAKAREVEAALGKEAGRQALIDIRSAALDEIFNKFAADVRREYAAALAEGGDRLLKIGETINKAEFQKALPPGMRGEVKMSKFLTEEQAAALGGVRESAIAKFATREQLARMAELRGRGDTGGLNLYKGRIVSGFSKEQRDIMDRFAKTQIEGASAEELARGRDEFDKESFNLERSTEINLKHNRELASIAKSRLLSEIKLRDIHRDLTDSTKDRLSFESRLLSTSQARKSQLEGELKSVEGQEKIFSKLASETTKSLSEGLFGEGVKRDPKKLEEMSQFVSGLNLKLREGKEINAEDAKLIAAKAKKMGLLNVEAETFEAQLRIQSREAAKEAAMFDAKIKKQTFYNSLLKIQNDITKNNLDALERQLTVTSDIASSTNRLEQARLDRRVAELEARKVGVGNASGRGIDAQISALQRDFATQSAARERTVIRENLRANIFRQARQLNPALLGGGLGTGTGAELPLQQRLLAAEVGNEFEQIIDDLNQKQKELQKKELEDNFKAFERQMRIIDVEVAATNLFATSVESFDRSIRSFNPFGWWEGLSRKLGGGIRRAAGAGAEAGGGGVGRVDFDAKGEVEAERDALKKALAGLQEGAVAFTKTDVVNAMKNLAAVGEELAAQHLKLKTALEQAGASAITFSNLLRNEFLNLDEKQAQNLFNVATATDRGSLSAGLIQSLETEQLIKGPKDLGGLNDARRATRRRQMELNLAGATGYAQKMSIFEEFEKTEELLALRDQMNEDGISTHEQLVRLLEKAKELEEERVSISKSLAKKLLTTEEELHKNFVEGSTDAVVAFRDGLQDGIKNAILGTGDLKDALLGAVTAFNNKLLDTALDSIFGGISNSIGSALGVQTRNKGGMINGGSGRRDDVPALLTGGEFVVNRESVQKYGRGFFEMLNAGTVQGFQQGGFFAPGLFGQGPISGKDNLLDFATQAFTTGGRDVIFGGGNVAAIGLEPESVRLSSRGRRMGTPSQRATQDAKAQAFDLFIQQGELEERLREQERQRKRALKNQLLLAGASILGASMLQGGIAAVDAANFSDTASIGERVGTFLKGTIRGGQIGGESYGGLTNIFSPGFRGFQSGPDIPRAIPVRGATGGQIPPAAGMDTVGAMLNGSEFVMNTQATNTIGAGNLTALNAGASSFVTEDTAEDLNQRLLDKLDEVVESSGSGMGDINITVNSNGQQVTEGGEQGGERNQNLARQIRDAVVNVIEQEKRLGGSLRRGLA